MTDAIWVAKRLEAVYADIDRMHEALQRQAKAIVALQDEIKRLKNVGFSLDEIERELQRVLGLVRESVHDA